MSDLAAAVVDGEVWVGLAIACVAGVVFVALGVPTARRSRLLDSDADAVETLSVGLSTGLLAFAAVWASVASGGRSVFVPVAVAIAVAVAFSDGRWTRRVHVDRASIGWAFGGVAFLAAIGVLYAATIAPSARDGNQPVEFFDVGYYSVLGNDLARDGRETIYSPSGFDHIAGTPDQTWYHWGELWLAASAIDATGISPIRARHSIVLPLLLLAAVTMAGTLVRRLVSPSNEVLVLAGAAMLFLAPIPLLRSGDVEWFARGLIVSITQYGLAVVVVLLGLYYVTSRGGSNARSGAAMGGAIAAGIVASHIGIAAIVLAGGALVATVVAGRARSTVALPPAAWAAVSVALTVLWGLATGHSLGGLAASHGIGPFDSAWQESVIGTMVGAGLILAAPIGASWVRTYAPLLTGAAAAATASVFLGAVAWGTLIADLNTFHLLFGAITAALTPVSIVVVVMALGRARTERRWGLSRVLLVGLLGQTTLSALLGVVQLRAFGPLDYPPTPADALAGLRALPQGAKAAYSCRPVENFAPWDASLVSIDAHTQIRMVPMCFMADRPRVVLGRELDPTIASPFFALAPQRALYPTAEARPSEADVRSFLNANGIAYIYADAAHPNTLVPDARPVLISGPVTIYTVS